MQRFKNILLVCDEESLHESLIGRAIWLAKTNAARITLVDVIEATPGELASLYGALPGDSAAGESGPSDSGPSGSGYDIEQEVLAFHKARLAQIGGPIKSEGIETSEVVLQGIPFIEIVRRVLRHGHDLVMKGVTEESGGKGLFFAGDDLHILRKCPCPVWMMKQGSQPKYARVLAAVDPDPMDEQRSALDSLVMDLATSLSAAEGSELHVVNVWHLDGENALRHSAFTRVSKETIEKMIEEKRRQSHQKLKSLLFDYPEIDGPEIDGPEIGGPETGGPETGGRERQVHLLKGEARDVIPAFAKSNNVDLIVMGTVGRTGIRGFFVGNTAESILNQVECSVLAVKPPGFKTPVQLDADPETVVEKLERRQAGNG